MVVSWPSIKERARRIGAIGVARVRGGWTATRAWAARGTWKPVLAWTGGVFGVLIGTLVLFVAFADWNAYRGPISGIASGIVGRPIEISGDLDVHPWSLAPRIVVNDLVIGDPSWGRREGVAWADDGVNFATVPRGVAEVELFPLLTGAIVLRRLELERPDVRLMRDSEARANWSRSPNAAAARPMKLPVVKRFVITGGRLSLDDRRRDMLLEAVLASDEELQSNGRAGFELTGEGTLNRRPFKLELTGPALINVRRDRPYAFRFDLVAGATRVLADGQLVRPFDLGRYHANLRVTGSDLADLYYVIGLSLPNTPPYALNGVLRRDPTRYTIEDIGGRVGDSDLRGALTVLTNRERPFVEARFRSNRLDFDDLAAVLGAPPSTDRGESASSDQRAMAARMEAQGRLLPDAPLDLNRVRNMDAHLDFAAARVVDAPIPLRGASVDLTLDQGVLSMTPVNFELPQGRVRGNVRIDARQDVPDVNVDARLTGARLESLIPVENAVSGPLTGRLVLHGRGATVRQAAATSNGTITFVTPRGQIREAFAELTGINVVRGLGLLLSEDDSQAVVRCGVADFRVRSGVAERRLLVFDTEDVLIVGQGGFNLDNERIDILLQGQPKEPRLLRVAAPISVSGRLRSPQVGVQAGAVLGQAGVAGALATLLSPLAAILPFVDPGLAEDADCGALMSMARGAAPRAETPAPARPG